MTHSGILQRVSGILRISENDSVSVISDYGDFSVSLPIDPGILYQANGQQVTFDLCSKQDGGFQANNIEFVDPPQSASGSFAQDNHPQSSTRTAVVPQNDESSISDIPEELICSICQEVLRDPVVTKCDHLFCRKCINEWIKSQSVCPMDRTPVTLRDLKSPPRYLTNILDNMKVRCDYHESGCKLAVPLANLETHLKDCPFGKAGQKPNDHLTDIKDQIPEVPLSIEESSAIQHQRHEQWDISIPFGTPQLSVQWYGESPMIWRPLQFPSLPDEHGATLDFDTESSTFNDSPGERPNPCIDEWLPGEEFSDISTENLYLNYQHNQLIGSNACDNIDDLSVECVNDRDGLSALSADFRNDLFLDSISFEISPAWSRDNEYSSQGISEPSNTRRKRKRDSKHRCNFL